MKKVTFSLMVIALTVALAISVAAPVSAQAMGIYIDIKPGSDPNALNVKSKGVLPVAILTTDTFDASTVDPETMELCYTDGCVNPLRWALEDVDGDGDIDMVLKFKTQEIVAQNLSTLDPGDVATLELEGEDTDEHPIRGFDNVIITSVGYT